MRPFNLIKPFVSQCVKLEGRVPFFGPGAPQNPLVCIAMHSMCTLYGSHEMHIVTLEKKKVFCPKCFIPIRQMMRNPRTAMTFQLNCTDGVTRAMEYTY